MIGAQVLSLLPPGLATWHRYFPVFFVLFDFFCFFLNKNDGKKLCLKPADMSDGGLNKSYPTDHSGHWQGRPIITYCKKSMKYNDIKRIKMI